MGEVNYMFCESEPRETGSVISSIRGEQYSTPRKRGVNLEGEKNWPVLPAYELG